ncbi:alpha-L-fucosidase [Formosa sp. PL04]|uniref:alpha-L-fucosidase n=1 Tax=Formosa sp. PL04 TaxID=3081755 RepID=UPI0029822EAA|nr:alpha-L-fucosidase [Formosa sp. PL04]MDW5290831.1 alpha-L-fucosidase [Formosa sp. PL04]
MTYLQISLKHITIITFLLFVNITISQEKSLAEDPFELELHSENNTIDRPWIGRSKKELQEWAKSNLHRKLIANREININEHKEWAWFRKSGLGIFLHWGLPSANPNTGDAWAVMWSEKKEKANRYMEPAENMFAVADTWNPEKYDPNKWMKAANKAGFKYAVLTSRHHDGYALWPSNYGHWDTGDKMNGRDLIRDYIKSCKENNIKVGLYYSGPNWHYEYKHKEFEFPKTSKYTINYKHEKVNSIPKLTPAMKKAETEESNGQVRELMKNYGAIDVMWWDGSILMQPDELKEMQPNILVARGNIATPEGLHQGSDENLKTVNECGWWWEMCVKSENTFTPNWHYGIENETNYWSTNQLLSELIRCRAFGGNLLVNIPPKGNGEMMDWYYQLTDDMEKWMSHSSEAIYDVDLVAPLPTLDKTMNYTTVKKNVYYSLPDDNNKILIIAVDKPDCVALLRTKENIPFTYNAEKRALEITISKENLTDLPDLVKIVFNKKQ